MRPLATESGRIGPNAVLQLVPLLESAGGPALRDMLLAEAGLSELPDGEGLIPEAPVARLHQELRRRLPGQAAAIASEAGHRTADYIIAHRIPAAARALLRALPPALARPLLARAITRHAWTFAGSGGFRLAAMHPITFEIRDNPVVRGERAAQPVCQWHAAVFERLFRELADPHAQVTETTCCAAGARACRFEVRRAG